MTNALHRFIELVIAATGSPPLAVMIVSMLPLVELKGGIPFGVVGNLGVAESFLYAYLGSTLVIIPIFFLLKPILALLKRIRFVRKLAESLEAVIAKKGRSVAEKRGGSAEKCASLSAFTGVLCFVALPLPLTGVWMGTAIAVFLGLRFWQAFAAIAIGNLTAGAIITLITLWFADYADIILLALALIAITAVAISVFPLFCKEKKRAKK